MSELGLLAQELSDAVMAGNARLDGRFCEAMSNSDIDGIMACFLDSPDLVVVLYGRVLRGPASVRQFFADLFTNVMTVRLQVDKITRWSVGEIVFALGIRAYGFQALDGTKSMSKECWTDVRQKVEGRWVYILHHATRIS
jgi:ketosteroid isomerase-like protein